MWIHNVQMSHERWWNAFMQGLVSLYPAAQWTDLSTSLLSWPWHVVNHKLLSLEIIWSDVTVSTQTRLAVPVVSDSCHKNSSFIFFSSCCLIFQASSQIKSLKHSQAVAWVSFAEVFILQWSINRRFTVSAVVCRAAVHGLCCLWDGRGRTSQLD